MDFTYQPVERYRAIMALLFFIPPMAVVNILGVLNLSSSEFNAYNLDMSIILSFGKELTHYHTTTHFDALKIYSCGKHGEKRRNCL